MKLILTDEVSGLGSAGDVVEVKDGYGRNFLLPRGKAVMWTKGGEKQVAQIKRARGAREIRNADHAAQVRGELAGLTVVVSQRAGDGGRLFGSVSTGDIVTAIAAAGGPALDKAVVTLSSPVKTVGKHSAKVALHSDVVVDLAFEVVPA